MSNFNGHPSLLWYLQDLQDQIDHLNADIALAVAEDNALRSVIADQERRLREREATIAQQQENEASFLPQQEHLSDSIARLAMSDHHHSHDHGHDHEHSHADHDHSHDLEPALQSNLYSKIEFDNIVTLNETAPKTGAAIVKKTWAQRLDNSPELASDADDEQLLMHIPFAGSVKLHSILIRSSDSPSAPRTINLFRNKTDIDFSAAQEYTPTQSLTIPRSNDVVEMPLNRAKWNGTTSIDLFFEDNYGYGDEDVTRVQFLGFKGEWTALNREAVSVLYEAAANPRDHALMQGLTAGGQQSLGQ